MGIDFSEKSSLTEDRTTAWLRSCAPLGKKQHQPCMITALSRISIAS